MGEVDAFFNQYGGQHLILWVPSENESMVRMMGSLTKLAVGCKGRALSFSLVLPFKAPPGVDSYEEILDLFSHPLLGGKWDDIVEGRSFLIQPGSYTHSGAYGPITSSMSFLWVDVGMGSNGIPLQENEPLAAVLSKVELGEEIPESLYLAVAQVIAFAYQLSGKVPNG